MTERQFQVVERQTGGGTQFRMKLTTATRKLKGRPHRVSRRTDRLLCAGQLVYRSIERVWLPVRHKMMRLTARWPVYRHSTKRYWFTCTPPTWQLSRCLDYQVNYNFRWNRQTESRTIDTQFATAVAQRTSTTFKCFFLIFNAIFMLKIKCALCVKSCRPTRFQRQFQFHWK